MRLLLGFGHHVKGRSFDSLIRKCSLVASVYQFWQERNLRIFLNRAADQDQIIRILPSIRDYLSSLRKIKPSQQNQLLLNLEPI